MSKKYIILLGVGLIILTGVSCGKQNSGEEKKTTSPAVNVETNKAAEVQNDNSDAKEKVDSPAEIFIENFAFSPSSITVTPGTTITVTNKDSVAHTLTSKIKGLFDTDRIASNASATFTAPIEKGEYSFYCSPHPYMTGKIIVE